MTEEKKGNSVAIIYSICKEAIDDQINQKNSLETKANTLTAFAGGMFALLMGARDALIKLPPSGISSLLISIVLFAISVILCTIVTWIRRYYVSPSIEVLVSKYTNITKEETQLQLIANMRSEWKKNDIKLERNAWLLRGAFIAQTIAFLLLGVALFISVL